MNKKAFDNFYEYLKEVIKYYQETGGLRNFSHLSKKWGVKAITKEQFYLYELHKIHKGETITRVMSDHIRETISLQRRRQRNPLSKGDIVAWNNNSYRSVAVIEDGYSFSVCLNYRGKEDEQNRIWTFDEIPSDAKIEKATEDDMKRIIEALVKSHLGLFG